MSSFHPGIERVRELVIVVFLTYPLKNLTILNNLSKHMHLYGTQYLYVKGILRGTIMYQYQNPGRNNRSLTQNHNKRNIDNLLEKA